MTTLGPETWPTQSFPRQSLAQQHMALNRALGLSQLAAPGHRQITMATSLVCALIAGALVMTPFAKLPLLPIPGYMSAFGAFMVAINLLLAALLFSRGMIEKQGSAIRLGAVYFFVAAIFVPLLAAFPGSFVPSTLLGTDVSAVWLWSFWHAGFGLGIIRYALGGETARASVPRSIAGTVALVVLLVLIATAGLPYLPTLLADGHTLFTGVGAAVPPAILAILVVALAIVLSCTRPSPERLWLSVGLVAALFDVWLTYCGTARFSLGWYAAKGGSLVTSLSMVLALMHDATDGRHRVTAANSLLLDLAHLDGLTGLANRRMFDHTIDVEWRRAARDRQPISVMMVDVDFFKLYNDRFGHARGDDCLRQIAAVLQAAIRRPADCVARYGGEEFALILPATTAAGAAALAAHIHAELRALALPHEASPLGRVSVSIGLATMMPIGAAGYADLLAVADSNLYRAKKSGRNRSATDQPPAPAAMEAVG